MTDDTTTVVSYNRPLTRGAEAALKPYGIVEKESPREYNRWTVVELERRPERDVLEGYELRIEEAPDRVFESDHGETVEVYPDRVVVDGIENGISPTEAVVYAEEHGWEEVAPDGE